MTRQQCIDVTPDDLFACSDSRWNRIPVVFVRQCRRIKTVVTVDLCEQYGLDFVDCVEHAYSVIKDRKGYLRSDGVFIKEE